MIFIIVLALDKISSTNKSSNQLSKGRLNVLCVLKVKLDGGIGLLLIAHTPSSTFHVFVATRYDIFIVSLYFIADNNLLFVAESQ